LALAEAINQDVQYIADIEAGTANPYSTEIGSLARRLGIQISELFRELQHTF